MKYKPEMERGELLPYLPVWSVPEVCMSPLWLSQGIDIEHGVPHGSTHNSSQSQGISFLTQPLSNLYHGPVKNKTG